MFVKRLHGANKILEFYITLLKCVLCLVLWTGLYIGIDRHEDNSSSTTPHEMQTAWADVCACACKMMLGPWHPLPIVDMDSKYTAIYQSRLVGRSFTCGSYNAKADMIEIKNVQLTQKCCNRRCAQKCVLCYSRKWMYKLCSLAEVFLCWNNCLA